MATKQDKTTVAENGTSEQGALAAGDEAVVLAPDAGATKPGGPGAGAAMTAQAANGVITEPLTDAAAAHLGLRGPAPLTEAERLELQRLRESTDPNRMLLDVLRRERAGVVIDAKAVPGQRLAQAATFITRNGVDYAPDGERSVPVDYEAYVELRQIGAIVDAPWDALEEVPAAAES